MKPILSSLVIRDFFESVHGGYLRLRGKVSRDET